MLISTDKVAEVYAARLIMLDDALFAGQDLYDMCVASFNSPDTTQEKKDATKAFAENVMKYISEHDMIYAEKILEIYMTLLLEDMTGDFEKL
tara:strand:- start:897 stop:1172 length:276 start_codon:yes stop_codon:yes gene_type:complete